MNGAAAFGSAQTVAIEAFQVSAHVGRQRDALDRADAGKAVTADHETGRAGARRTLGTQGTSLRMLEGWHNRDMASKA